MVLTRRKRSLKSKKLKRTRQRNRGLKRRVGGKWSDFFQSKKHQEKQAEPTPTQEDLAKIETNKHYAAIQSEIIKCFKQNVNDALQYGTFAVHLNKEGFSEGIGEGVGLTAKDAINVLFRTEMSNAGALHPNYVSSITSLKDNTQFFEFIIALLMSVSKYNHEFECDNKTISIEMVETKEVVYLVGYKDNNDGLLQKAIILYEQINENKYTYKHPY